MAHCGGACPGDGCGTGSRIPPAMLNDEVTETSGTLRP